jgi:hypothetical protein
MYKLKLNQIREVLGMPVKLERAKLADGTEVEVEKLEIGFPVQIVAADGTLTSAPEGEHTLADGTKIKVDANGTIMEIMPKEEEEAESVEIEIPIAAAEEKPMEDKKEEVLTEMEKKMDEKMKMLFAAIEEVATEVKTIKEEMTGMKEKMQKFSKEPAGNKIPKETAHAAEVAGDALETRLASIAELKKSFKK